MRLLIRNKSNKRKKIHCQALGKFRRQLERRDFSNKHRSMSCMSYVRPAWVRRVSPQDKAYRYLKKVL